MPRARSNTVPGESTLDIPRIKSCKSRQPIHISPRLESPSASNHFNAFLGFGRNPRGQGSANSQKSSFRAPSIPLQPETSPTNYQTRGLFTPITPCTLGTPPSLTSIGSTLLNFNEPDVTMGYEPSSSQLGLGLGLDLDAGMEFSGVFTGHRHSGSLQACTSMFQGSFQDALIEFDQDNDNIIMLDDVPTTLSPLTPSGPNQSPESAVTDHGEPFVVKPRKSTNAIVRQAINLLQRSRISPVKFLIHILDETRSEYATHQAQFYNSDHFLRLLTLFWESKKGHIHMKDWLHGPALDSVCEQVHSEMEAAKPHLSLPLKEVSLDFLSGWDVNNIMEPISEKITPTWARVLQAATDSKGKFGREEDDSQTDEAGSHSRNRGIGQNIISAQTHFLRSRNSNKFQIGLGLMASACGTSKQMINVLHRSSLSISYSGLSNLLDTLAARALDEARTVAADPHIFTCDNINFSGSIFAEQAPHGMSKVQSGTMAVIYELLNPPSPDVMLLAPLVERMRSASPLTKRDLRPSEEAMDFFNKQCAVNVVKILCKYHPSFSSYLEHEELQNLPRRQLPSGHPTRFYPLPASTIEEASVKGNLLLQDDFYLVQLGLSTEDLDKRAIIMINDQLTNARIRGGQILRSRDLSPWKRRDSLQTAFGLFHLDLNLNWAILNVHRGSSNQLGCLSNNFVILEKVRLGQDRPDYQTLSTALHQVLAGYVLNGWREECGYSTLNAFAESNPSLEELLRIAKVILVKYATPSGPVSAKKNKGTEDTSSTSDNIHENTVRLTRDLLYMAELESATSDGDFGRIEDILPDLACIFRAAGSNNYSTEILHFLFNLKNVWTPEFGDVVRDSMLVNPSGLQGHFMPIDLNMEHLIGGLKTIFSSKGIYANWDRASKISTSIKHLHQIKVQVTRSLQLPYQGSTHIVPERAKELVWRMANRAREEKLQKVVEGRSETASLVPDLRAFGQEKFISSSLKTFNQKLKQFIAGKVTEEMLEEEDLPRVNLAFRLTDDSENSIN